MLRPLRRAVRPLYWWLSEVILTLLGRRPPYGVLKLRLAGDLADQTTAPRLPGIGPRQREGYLSLLAVLRWAREDPALRAVFIHCEPLRVGWAKIQEISRCIAALRVAGKRVWVYFEQAGIHEYVLAAAADRVILAPAGTLDIVGLSSEVTFLAGALQKLGIEAELVQLGKYKSAGEAFTRTAMSAPHREMVESLSGDLYDQIVAAVATGRKIDATRARELLDRGPFLAAQALNEKLIDALQYADEAETQLLAECGDPPTIERRAYFGRRARTARRAGLQHADVSIGLLSLSGAIKTGENLSGLEMVSAAGADAVASDLRELRERDDVRAIVLRISSPGGSGLASDLIWHEVQRTRKRKPVVVSFGDVAASGGYYIGVAGSPIIAEAGTITGSIGVLAGKAVLRGLYDRLGVTKEIVTHGRHAGLHSDYLPLGDEERAVLQTQAESFYADFVNKVAAGRQLTPAVVEAAAQGRVWTGRQAHALGLVDQLGGLECALEEAKVLAGFQRNTPISIEPYPRPKRLWQLPFNRSAGRERAGILHPWVRLIVNERLWAVLPLRIRFF